MFRSRPGKLHSNLEYDAIGVTYWMEGHKDLALAFWRHTTRSLAENRVGYANMGGGIESGLLLWFGAVKERRVEDVALVRILYENRLASKHWSHSLTNWPGPIVQYFFERIDEPALLDSASGRKQAMCQANFALAVRARELGRHAAYRKHMKLVAPGKGPGELYDYYNVLPYFLGRSEVGNADN